MAAFIVQCPHCNTEINKEFTAFIIETAEKGKQVRAWTFHAEGGMGVTISGRKVIIDKQ